MSSLEGTLCFTCGLPIADPPRFNHLPSGRPCPTCKDRLLESLPPLLPAEPAETTEPGQQLQAPEELRSVESAGRGPGFEVLRGPRAEGQERGPRGR